MVVKSKLIHNGQTAANDRDREIPHHHFTHCFTNEGKFDIKRFKTQIQKNISITGERHSKSIKDGIIRIFSLL